MNLENIFTKKRIIFLGLFFTLVLVAKNINFSAILGQENQFFTLYQFFAPTAGALLGPVFGIIAVVFAQLTDFLIVGKEFNLANLLRFLPMLFAVYYFGSKKSKLSNTITIAIPAVCMILFIMHPIGGAAWFFSLYWLIPIFGRILPDKVPGKLFFKSFGATFTAHAIGSTLWLYTFPGTVDMWVGLIPVVAYERFLFGLGIAGSYVVFNTVLDYTISKWNLKVPTKILLLDRKYNLMRMLNLKKD